MVLCDESVWCGVLLCGFFGVKCERGRVNIAEWCGKQPKYIFKRMSSW